MPWTPLCELADLHEGVGKYVEASGYCLAIFLHAGKVRVIDNACPHAGANLSAGWIDDGCVVCPKHGWPFRLEDGQLRDTPGVNVDVYAVRLLERAQKSPLVEAQLPERSSV